MGVSGGPDAGLTWTYTYDDMNRMTSAVETNGSTTLASESMTHNAEGNRIETVTTVGSTTTTQKFAYLDNNIYAVLSATGTVQERELFGDQENQIFGSSTSSGASWMLTDDLGSVRLVTNASGSVVDSIVYDAYGNITGETDPSARGLFGYTGAVYDAGTGYWYQRARYYDPASGRWISEDPLGFDAGDNNLYRYVGNDPVNATDPSGQASLWGFISGEDEISIGGHTFVSPLHPNANLNPVDNVQAYAGATQQVVKDVVTSLGHGIEFVKSATGEAFARVGRFVVHASQAAAQFIADQGKWVLDQLGISVDKVLEKLEWFAQFGANVTQLISDVFNDPKKVIGNLFEGAKIGFEQFSDLPHNFRGFPDRIVGKAAQWLFGGLDLSKLPALPKPWQALVAIWGVQKMVNRVA